MNLTEPTSGACPRPRIETEGLPSPDFVGSQDQCGSSNACPM
jgi:hypothetical protein